MNEKGESNIEILNSELKRQLALTKTDTKFINSLLQIVDQRSDATGSSEISIKIWQTVSHYVNEINSSCLGPNSLFDKL